ncbi:MAG: hypothetical protein A3E80_01320 [Chlamydiae bacterium RIFCSPHIGHO2_12_FULL_49_9]|nr:MAG: hypothetical protein A3E80_01320 [Chlamydiae bacterium RIFCSPHIGHO2_12_FULL_49_9]
MRVLFFLSLIPSLFFGNMGPQGFRAHPNRYFVETGSYMGNGIRMALRAGFEYIHSLEIEPQLVNHCRKRFNKNPRVTIWHRDSSYQLWEVIEPIQEEITFWLDGHLGTPDPHGGKNTPLIEELEQIKRHSIKTHTILIDDLHCCRTILFDYLTLEEIVKKVLEINPEYEISFEPGGDAGEYPNNILVAQVKRRS